MTFFCTVSKGKTTVNGEQKFGFYPTDNAKLMNFEAPSANGSSGKNGVFNSGKTEPLRAKFRVRNFKLCILQSSPSVSR
jgi:hypothetical protein